MSKKRWRTLLVGMAAAVVAEVGCSGNARLTEQVPVPFFVTFEKGERTACCGLALTKDGGLAVVGRADTVVGRSWAWVSKFSRLGSIEWEREWSRSPEYSDLTAVTEVDDGAIVATGATVARVGDDPTPRRVGLMMRIDSTGSVAWRRTVRLAGPTEVRGVVPDRAGGVVIVGAFEHQANRWTLFVASVTAHGDIGEPMVIGQAQAQWIRAVHELPGRGYVVISDSGDVIRLDQMRRPLWQRQVEDVADAMGLPDGSVVLVGVSDDRTGVRLLRLNPQGEIMWERRVSDPTVCASVAMGIWPRQEDELIVVSESCDDSGSLSLVVVTDRGEERLTLRAPISPKTNAAIVRPGPMGSVVAVGMFMQDDSPNARKGWLFRSGSILGTGR